MKKIKTKHYIEYAALRAVELAVNIVPRPLALPLGASVGRLLCLFGVYRKVALKNFGHVGLWDENEVRKILPSLYRNIGRYAVDFLRRSRRLPPHRLHDYEIYQKARAAGKGTVIVLAHFGNWEILASIWGKQVGDLNVVAKPMANPLVEAWLHKKRTALSVNTIYTQNALRGMLTAIRRNGVTAILIDQYLGGGMGTPAPFLGKTASTVRTVAGIVRKTGAAVVPVYALMGVGGRYDIHFFDVGVDGVDGEDEDAAINAIQAQHNDILSGWIRQHPAHWFGWFHRRFRGYLDYK